MIGNDIIDIRLAQKQSNWQRKNYLKKLFSANEQIQILQSINPEIEMWKLWSRKEAAYKIYNRATGIRGFFPWKLICSNVKDEFDTTTERVTIEDKTYFTKTYTNKILVYTVAVSSIEFFKKVASVDQNDKIIKIDGLPFLEKNNQPVSITHHGRFERKITLIDS